MQVTRATVERPARIFRPEYLTRFRRQEVLPDIGTGGLFARALPKHLD